MDGEAQDVFPGEFASSGTGVWFERDAMALFGKTSSDLSPPHVVDALKLGLTLRNDRTAVIRRRGGQVTQRAQCSGRLASFEVRVWGAPLLAL